MKKVLLLSLFGVFAYAKTPVKEETKEIKKGGTTVCGTSPVSGTMNGYPTQFTTVCCMSLPADYSAADYLITQVNMHACADAKRDAILQILND
jgi:hypothetical protein